MHLIFQVVYVFTLSSVHLCSSNLLTAHSFKIYLQDKLIYGFYEQSVKRSKIECGSVCSSTTVCFAFGFHQIRRECFLYDRFPADCDGFEDSGMLLYIPSEENKENVSVGKPTAMSTEKHNMSSCRGVDGDLTTHFHTHKVALSWWCVDLLKTYDFNQITIFNRNVSSSVPGRLQYFEIGLSNDGSCDNSTFLTASWCYKDNQSVRIIYYITGCNISPIQHFGSRFIFIKLERNPPKALHFEEMLVSVA